jgi:CDP-diacylglycerol---glycerol-3-phosphate 3-phosphatidyltransferase
MYSTADFFTALTLTGFTLVGVLVYFLRVAFIGHAQFDRVEKQGSSPLLGRSLMEAAHWVIQPLLKTLAFLRVTPNQVSFSSLFFGALAALFLAVGQFGLGAALSVAAAFADLVDGSLARLTGVASDAGEVLDAAIDRYVEFLFLGALVFYYRSVPAMQIVCMAAIVGSFMVSYSTAKAEALGVSLKSGAMRRPERAFYLILGATLTGVSIPAFEMHHTRGGAHVPLGYPIVAAVFFVAVVSNYVSVKRFTQIAEAIRARENLISRKERRLDSEADDNIAGDSAEKIMVGRTVGHDGCIEAHS